MVLPPKPEDVRTPIPLRKTITKLKPELEQKYDTDIPVKKLLPSKLKSPLPTPKTIIKKTIVKTNNVTSNSKVSPKMSKLSKKSSQQPSPDSIKRESVAQSKSHIIKPTSSTIQKQHIKLKKPIMAKKKQSLEGKKSDPMNRLLKITDTEESDIAIMPKRFKTNESKFKNAIIRKVSNTKKYKKPLVKSEKDLKQESIASLTTHYRMPYIPSELKPITKAPNKPAIIKKRKTSTLLKKNSKPDEEDTTKETKNPRKSKLFRSSDSVPVLSIREIKHNDSFIISARKLQKSSSERRDSKSYCLKLRTMPSSFIRSKRDNLPLKSCLKNTLEGKNKIKEKHKSEGKMKFNETFFSNSLI